MESQPGRVTVAPNVLATIARLTTLSVPGVVRMSKGFIQGVKGLLRPYFSEGVYLSVEDNVVSMDLYITVQRDVNMLKVSREVQTQVARAIQDIVGMPVREINVHIVDVEEPATKR